MPPFTVSLQHPSDPISAAGVAKVSPPSPMPVGDPHTEPQLHTTGDPNPDMNHSNDGFLPAYPNSPSPPVMGLVEQGNQTPNASGPSAVAHPGPFTQGLPGLEAVGPGAPNNLSGPLSSPLHPPDAAGPLQGNIGPDHVRMSTAEGLKRLASRYLYDPRSRVAEICMTQKPSGGIKVMIVLDVDGTM